VGYFSNGTEGKDYEVKFCERCIHQKPDDGGCAVWFAHLLYNYDQQDREQSKLKSVLDILIPCSAEGVNAGCMMFVAAIEPKEKT